MITKGLDFDHVSVVGILSADLMMNYPDFRAHERAFQMMEQVSGTSRSEKSEGSGRITDFAAGITSDTSGNRS